MTYLFLGENHPAKFAKIAELKEKYLPSVEAVQFDYEHLSASHLSSEDLKKTFLAMPAMAKYRLVMISDLHKLSPRNKEILKETIEQKLDQLVLILDSPEWDERESFVTSIKPFVKIFSFQTRSSINVFDLTRCISGRNQLEALKILTQLLSNGEHPLKIMGGIVWFWGKSRERLSPQKFYQGLNDLKEADLNIKRSRLNPDHALELLVVKLCS